MSSDDNEDLFEGVQGYPERWKGTGLRYWLISLIDYIDDEILHHRYYALCRRVEASTWWGNKGGTGTCG